MFEKFGDYLFFLLPGPLKMNKSTNQLAIFFKVIGKEFDQMKQDMLQLRLESMISTCSPAMLEVFGKDRDMTRINGESTEGFRKRLLMKAIIAELAGSEKGIIYALNAVGYLNVSIEPLWKTDVTRWAEFYVDFRMKDLNDTNSIDFDSIKKEVLKVKQARSKPNYRTIFPTGIDSNEGFDTRIKIRFSMEFWDTSKYLNGGFLLNGTLFLDGDSELLNTILRNRITIENDESIPSVTIIIKNDLWYLDDTFDLSGVKALDAYELEEEL